MQENKRVRLQLKIFADMPPEDITKVVEQTPYNKMSIYQQFKSDNHYHLAENRKKDGRMCKNCAYLINDGYHNKRYYKCQLLGYSRGEATDIRLSYVCDRFKTQEEIRKEMEKIL